MTGNPLRTVDADDGTSSDGGYTYSAAQPPAALPPLPPAGAGQTSFSRVQCIMNKRFSFCYLHHVFTTDVFDEIRHSFGGLWPKFVPNGPIRTQDL